MKKHLNTVLVVLIFVGVGLGLTLNIQKQRSIDRSKLPERVEEDRLFQRWITNIKNKGLDIEADEFNLKEENEIYNTTWMSVYSADDPDQKALYEKTVEENKGLDKVVFSPNERVFIDFRNIDRGDVMRNEVRLYGLKEDKIIDARILDCSINGNCYFDRAYFLDNDVFVITEFSRNISKKDPNVEPCPIDEECTYTIKLHYVDLIHNSRAVYTSEPFDIILADWKEEL
jgi:hypothetical protein